MLCVKQVYKILLIGGDKVGKEINKIIKKSIKKLSKETCMVIAMEEIAELQEVISDILCGTTSYKHLVEEMVDVRLYMRYIMYIEDISDKDIKKVKEKIIKDKLAKYKKIKKNKKSTLKTLLMVSSDLSILQHGISKCIRGKMKKKDLIERIISTEISLDILADFMDVKKSDVTKISKKKIERNAYRNKHGW